MEKETIDQYSLILTKSQAESLREFNENVRRCETDSEKFSLCRQMRIQLLAQHDSVGTFIAVIEQVMLTICPKYKSYKRKRQTRGKVDDDEEWQRFIGVAAEGTKIFEKCLPHLKVPSLVWGRDKIQHYRWHHRGGSFCRKLAMVAKMMTWQEFVTKANRLLWRRATMHRKHRRRYIRDLPDPLDENELGCLRDWRGQDLYIKDKDPDQIELEPRALAPEELPDGFGFDRFGLLVHSQYAISTAEDGSNPLEVGPNTVTSLDPEHVDNEPRPVNQDTTMISPAPESASEVPSGDFIAFDFTATRLTEFSPSRENTVAGGLITPELGSPAFPDDEPLREENNIQLVDDAHNANDDTIAVIDDSSRPKV
jgi:hypothetical protein